MSVLTRSALGLYERMIRLYPGPFRDLFAEEMAFVFDQALEEAAHKSGPAVVALFFRELGDLPGTVLLAHLRGRRKQSAPGPGGELRLLRWAARLISLPVGGFFLSALLLNEDFRQAPTLPALVALALSLVMFSSWRWERAGGRTTLLGSPVLFLSIVAYNVAVGRASPAMILLGLFMTLPFVLVGWLFTSTAAQAAAYAQIDDSPASHQPADRRRLVLRLAAIGLTAAVLVALLVLGFLAPAGSTTVSGP